MLRKLKFPALLLGALMAFMGPTATFAADRGGHGGGRSGGGSYSRGRSYSGGGSRSYSNRGGGGRYEYRGGERDRYRGGYYGGSFYYGAPYAYAPSYPYYSAPNTCGYYDQWGNWQANPYCYAGPYGY
ncbi:MAG TPA: hypothetical protein VGN17_01825 [Bryobacteraceae bacterium]|jgi:hypothetical protein